MFLRKWEFWKDHVRSGLDLVDGFFDEVSQFDPWKRTFSAWAALMISIGEKEGAEKASSTSDGTTSASTADG